MNIASLNDQIDRDGFALVNRVFEPHVIENLKQHLDQGQVARSERDGDTYGARNLFSIPAVRETARSASLNPYLQQFLGDEFRAVRSIFFDKTANANWPVPWHQDLSLAVRERCDLAGWTNWTVKRGVTHVQAPSEILRRMIAVRVHLDDCFAENGPLRVIAGTHLRGQLSREDIQQTTKSRDETAIYADAGDALFMKPLLLHASSPARAPKHRRVLHLEFAPINLLPPELGWADAI